MWVLPKKFGSLAASRHVWTIAVMAANDGVYYFGKTSLNASFDQLWDKYHYHSGWRSELVGWNTRTGKWNEQMRKSRSLARPKNANRFYTDSAHLRESKRPFTILAKGYRLWRSSDERTLTTLSLGKQNQIETERFWIEIEKLYRRFLQTLLRELFPADDRKYFSEISDSFTMMFWIWWKNKILETGFYYYTGR